MAFSSRFVIFFEPITGFLDTLVTEQVLNSVQVVYISLRLE